MDNPSRMFSQIAAEAGVTEHRAKVSLYLFALAKDGRSLEQAAAAIKRKPNTVKKFARDFMIDFVDYRPFGITRDKHGEMKPRHSLNMS